MSDSLTPQERAIARARFAMSLCNLDDAHAYWCPSKRCTVFRSVSVTRRFIIPSDSVYVGRYSHPFAARDFVKDLEDVLSRLQVGTLSRLSV